MNSLFKKITIIGLGLIGSSIARAVREGQLASVIVGVDSNETALVYAQKHGFVDQTSRDATHLIAGSDVVIIATPTPLLVDICRRIAPHLSPGTLVMDTGSVKAAPLAVMTGQLPSHALIVPAHPIAGSEQSGVTAGRADLLLKKRVIITPEVPLTHEQLTLVNRFWEALGARVEAMPAAMHDTIYGYVSHLPQLLAFAAAPVVAADEGELSGNESLTRFLRIANSSHDLWDDIFSLNRDVLLAAIDRYLDVVTHIRKELSSAPADTESAISSSARISFFPRIVSACLITTVMEAEKNAGVPFVRFSGSGFADFTAPATTDPEGELEHISSHYAQIGELLDAFITRLQALRKTLE
ncbi:MAG: prephenate dehydrogenase/arogenate dehydrogenase family protein [Alphaproteobacteria bacterium]|nr:prephenate dehydrogenase/arogenate dehydrogenase family protein [Alphaproteobacteria bacterium]